jgi:hypothetical protein
MSGTPTAGFNLRTGLAPVVTKTVLQQAIEGTGSEYVVDLSAMGVERIKALDTAPLLRSLNLSFNKIAEIHGLESLLDLRELRLYGNRIARITGLSYNKKLERLLLQDNAIEVLEGLTDAKFCTLLRLDGNRIRELGGGLDKCLSLAELDISRNALSSSKVGIWEDAVNCQSAPNLLTLVAGSENQDAAVIAHVPQSDQRRAAGARIRVSAAARPVAGLQPAQHHRGPRRSR